MKPLDFIDVNVTQKHIKSGKANNCHHCPVALAVSESLKLSPENVNVRAGISQVYFNGGNEHTLYRMPEKATDFIHDFDIRNKVKPIKFRMTRIGEVD